MCTAGIAAIQVTRGRLPLAIFHTLSRDSSVGIGAPHGLDGQGSIPGRDKRVLSSVQRTDRLWGTPIPLSNWYWGLFPQG
jgi:hypothetical protein